MIHATPARADMSDANVYTAIDLETSGAISPDQTLDVLSTLDLQQTTESSDTSDNE